jgi:hypothetical protein
MHPVVRWQKTMRIKKCLRAYLERRREPGADDNVSESSHVGMGLLMMVIDGLI